MELLPDFQLCPLTPADLDAVAAIESATQQTPWNKRLFASCLKSGYQCQVIRHHHDIVAFQIISFVLDEAHLMNIAIAPAFQRRGLARALLTHAISDMVQAGSHFLYLETRASNHKAQALYLSLGFDHYADRRNYYRTRKGREDAWLMMKVL